jgi:hypothetical protein
MPISIQLLMTLLGIEYVVALGLRGISANWPLGIAALLVPYRCRRVHVDWAVVPPWLYGSSLDFLLGLGTVFLGKQDGNSTRTK